MISEQASGKRLLECGGATEKLTSLLAADGWECSQIDITNEGPLLARSEFANCGLSGTLATADVCQLPFADDTFDVVTSHGLLDLMPEIAPPISEMIRVLKPTGFFVSSFFPRRSSVQTVTSSLAASMRALNNLLRSGKTIRPTSDPAAYEVFRNSFPLEDYLNVCREAGLCDMVGTGVWPLPLVRLPTPLMPGYLRLLRKVEPQWCAFNRSQSAWTARWGAMLAVYGHKTSRNSPDTAQSENSGQLEN